MSNYEKLNKTIKGKSKWTVGGDGISQEIRNQIILRMVCMFRNKEFQSDCKKLRALKTNNDPDLLTRENEFFSKWGIDRDGIAFPDYTLKPVKIINQDYFGYLTLQLDLFQTKTTLLKHVENIVNEKQKEFKEIMQEEDFWEGRLRDGVNPKRGRTTKEQQKYDKELISKRRIKTQFQDISLYRQYLKAYDLREKGLTWEQVIAEMGFEWHTVKELDRYKSKVRNFERKARDLVNKGLPGFKPFPTTGVK